MSAVQIAQYNLPNNLFVAPMAGVTDRPFRMLCKRLGAGHAVSEMAASNPRVWASEKSARRLNHQGESAPIAVQIAGGDPALMAQMAQFNIERGAQIIDINMGCPAKKVCNALAGSALLKDEDLVARILDAVVQACAPHNVPVTLKTRTGWDRDNKNIMRVAQRAQDAGIALLTLHGRTRADLYTGQAEYDTIAHVKAMLKIPVIANGDIDSPEKALYVLQMTKADGVMIGRAAQGRPWIFREVAHYLRTGQHLAHPLVREVRELLLAHLQDHWHFYGEIVGVRTARKHIIWYTEKLQGGVAFCEHMNTLQTSTEQARAVEAFFTELEHHSERLVYVTDFSTRHGWTTGKAQALPTAQSEQFV